MPETLERRRLIVVFGGRSAEHEVSCTSARHVLAAIDTNRYDVSVVGIRRDGTWVRAEAAEKMLAAGPEALPAHLDAEGPDLDLLPMLAAESVPSSAGASLTVVFPVLHGPYGEDGTIQGLLEMADVAYVGTGVLGSALAMDKMAAKDVFTARGIPQALWRGLHVDELSPAVERRIVDELGLPVFVKPANMGSSVGVSRAGSTSELGAALELAAQYDEWIVVEEAIEGREIECSVLGNREPVASLPGEIRPAADFYDYDDKYLAGAAELLIPAPLDGAVVAELQALAIRAYQALRCEGLARVDFFYDEAAGRLLVNEINTMPGFTPISMYPKMWDASGLGYPELIDRLVDLAIERLARRAGHRRTEH
jgi:D-alanine-D-alanine ligase